MPDTVKLIVANEKNYIKWLEKIKRGTGDARPLWTAMTPKILEFINFQFNESSDTGKRWKSLTRLYRNWKVKKGFSPAIGVMTGKLKKAAGSEAKKRSTPTSLMWVLNNNVATSKGKKYAKYFNARRPIYRNVILRTTSFLNTDIKNFPNRTGFTYKWLRKSLIPIV